MTTIANRLREIASTANETTKGAVMRAVLKVAEELEAAPAELRRFSRAVDSGTDGGMYEVHDGEWVEHDEASATIAALQAKIAELEAKLNTPELHDFSAAVVLEAAHQRERWGANHDAGKQPADWFWLLGYLGGKALNAATSGNTDKALHHTISTAAACANWNAAISGKHTQMRPGIDPVERGIEAAPSKPTDPEGR